MYMVLAHTRLRMCWLGAQTHLGLLAPINCAGSHISGKCIHIHFINPKTCRMTAKYETSLKIHYTTQKLKIQSQKE
jgi:hypothetical protein